jgi:AcrR family transcriptional regulator
MVHVDNLRADAAKNRAKILEVARALIGAEGSAVSVEAIAKAAGVAVGTIYRHHPTKAALIAAVVNHSIEQIAAYSMASVERVEGGSPAGYELTKLFRLVAERHGADQAVKEAAAAVGSHIPSQNGEFAHGTPEHRAWQALQTLLDAAQQAGSVRPDLTPRDLVALVSGAPGSGHPTSVRDRYIDVVLAGIAVQPSA